MTNPYPDATPTPDPDLADALDRAALDDAFPDGSPGRFLTEEAATTLARSQGQSLRLIQKAALSRDIMPLRYARNATTFSAAEQIRLLDATLALAGLGGLGGAILEICLRAGVGTIVAADGDCFEETNLNRQLLADGASLGLPKAHLAERRAAELNPAATVTAWPRFLDEDGFLGLLDGANLAVDALGGLSARPALYRAAARAGIPLVTAAVAGLTGYLATVLPGGPAPSSVFGATGPAAEDTLGCPGPAVMALASLQAAEALRILAGRAPSLAGKALVVDLDDMSFETVRLA